MPTISQLVRRVTQSFFKESSTDEGRRAKWVDVDANNFVRVVYREDKDVLIIFYRQPAGDSPIAELTNLPGKYDNIIFAKCNVATSKPPLEVFHIPTIKIYPAHKKSLPVEYFGSEKDIAAVITFIKEATGKRSNP